MKSDREAALESCIDHEIAQRPMLWPCLATGDVREALNDILRTERRRLYRAALKLLGNVEDAEDAVQEALLAAFRNLQVRGPGSPVDLAHPDSIQRMSDATAKSSRSRIGADREADRAARRSSTVGRTCRPAT